MENMSPMSLILTECSSLIPGMVLQYHGMDLFTSPRKHPKKPASNKKHHIYMVPTCAPALLVHDLGDPNFVCTNQLLLLSTCVEMHYDLFGTSKLLASRMYLRHHVHPFPAMFQKISKCVEFLSLCEVNSTNKRSMPI